MKCSVCRHRYGSFRGHCPVCGASKNKVFWLFDGPNSWRKSNIDIDRPIHRASTSLRDIQITDAHGLAIVDDPYLLMARAFDDDDI